MTTLYFLNNSNTFSARSQLIIGCSSFSYLFYILVIRAKIDEEAYFKGVDFVFVAFYKNNLEQSQ
jgi:hypothetical protein